MLDMNIFGLYGDSMMTVFERKEMFKKAMGYVQKYGTRDPFIISVGCGAHVIFKYDFKKLMGMYSVGERRRNIFVNGNLPDEEQRMSCGHELGHDSNPRHRKIAQKCAMRDTSLFVRNTTDYEADLFCSHILLDEDIILEYMKEGYELDHIAAAMNVYEELLLIKLEDMNQRGLPVRAAYIPIINFWKRP